MNPNCISYIDRKAVKHLISILLLVYYDLTAPRALFCFPYFCHVKYLSIPVLVLFLASCSSKPVVTVVSQTGAQGQWILVSVRDSSVVLLAPYEETGKGIAFTHCVIMKSRDIQRIVLEHQTDFLSRIPMALFGAGTGLALKACNCDDRIYHIVIGFIIGYNLSILNVFFQSLKPDSYFLWLPEDRIKLSKESLYPVEPPIMQYLQ